MEECKDWDFELFFGGGRKLMHVVLDDQHNLKRGTIDKSKLALNTTITNRTKKKDDLNRD